MTPGLWAAGDALPVGPMGPTEVIVALITLTVMEIVLGIDNVIFIAVIAGRLPKSQQARARQLGLMVALVTRLMLLFTLSWIAGLKESVAFRFSWVGIPEGWLPVNQFSWRDVVMLVGGLFLIYKSTVEIHHKLEGHEEQEAGRANVDFLTTLVQISLIDIVFSLDSVITAVGMAGDHLWVMVTAMILSLGVMLVFAGPIADFVARHPTVKVLALSFLILIGVMLMVEGFHTHIPKGYIYFAMAFSFVVEMLNLRLRSRHDVVKLHEKQMPQGA